MGEASENLSKLSRKCVVNARFGSYASVLGLLGNIWVLQDIYFTDDATSCLREWAEIVGDCVCNTEVQRYMLSVQESKPEVAFALLNAAEQMFLQLTGQCCRRSELAKVNSKNWAGVSPDPFEDAKDIATSFCNKLANAAKSGEAITSGHMYENSLHALAMKRAADHRHADELLSITRAVERKATRGGRGDDEDNDRESKKARRDRQRTERDAARPPSSDADRVGGILCSTFLKVPTYASGKQPCGAGHKQGVACNKFVATGKCDRCHTPINDLPADKKELWRTHVNTTPGIEFNTTVVKCFKKVDGKWIDV